MLFSAGSRIGPFEIERPLGAGGMGEVYKAQDLRLKRAVALKLLSVDQVRNSDWRARLTREARALSALKHPNIVVIHDIISDNGTEALVMEFLAGKTLDKLIPVGGLPIDTVVAYALQIADAVGTANRAGIIHRDLKPSNIMVTETGVVKLLDFGLAKILHADTHSGEDQTTQTVDGGEAATQDGAIVGTVSYMSPEQAEGKPVDARSDTFSFGCVFYEMLTGYKPFRGDTKIATLGAILKDEPKPPTELRPDVPRSIEEIVLRCLRKTPIAGGRAFWMQGMPWKTRGRRRRAVRARPPEHSAMEGECGPHLRR